MAWIIAASVAVLLFTLVPGDAFHTTRQRQHILTPFHDIDDSVGVKIHDPTNDSEFEELKFYTEALRDLMDIPADEKNTWSVCAPVPSLQVCNGYIRPCVTFLPQGASESTKHRKFSPRPATNTESNELTYILNNILRIIGTREANYKKVYYALDRKTVGVDADLVYTVSTYLALCGDEDTFFNWHTRHCGLRSDDTEGIGCYDGQLETTADPTSQPSAAILTPFHVIDDSVGVKIYDPPNDDEFEALKFYTEALRDLMDIPAD